jgi:Tol biopolymer transport system component
VISNVVVIRSHLARVLSSHQFAKAPRLRQLLTYLVESTLEGRGPLLKESLVGIDVFERPADYDPKADPVVRVQVKRVRERLESYYSTAGAGDALRIILTRGSYAPQFSTARVAVAPAVEARHPAKWAGIAAFAIAAIVLIGIFIPHGVFRTSAMRAEAPLVRLRPFTSLPGNEFDAEWSPDASQVAFAWTDGPFGAPHLYLMREGQSEPRRVSESAAEESRPRWSPDAKRLAFYRRSGPGEFAVILSDVETGKESRVTSIRFAYDTAPVRPGMDWSPDGNWLPVTDQESPSTPSHIVLISIADGSRRSATSPPAASADVDVRFSPDGRRIAFQRGGLGQLFVQDLPLGPSTREKPLTAAGRGLRGMTWEDNETLICSFIADDWKFSLARVKISGGAPIRITPQGLDAEWPSYSRSAGRLIYTVGSRDVDIWKYSLADGTGHAVASSTRIEGSPSLSPDGKRLAFTSERSGVPEIWVSAADGSHPRQLTAFGGRALLSHTTWSPDGREIAFHARVEGNSDIYAVDAFGIETRRITAEGSREIFPSFSVDGRWIYFMSDRTGRMEVFRSGPSGTPAEQVTKTGAMTARETTDGHLVEARFDQRVQLWDRSLKSAEKRKLLVEEIGMAPAGTLRAYGDLIAYLTSPSGPRSESNLVAVNRKDGTTRTLIRVGAMPSMLEMGFTIAPNQRDVYIAREIANSSDLFVAEKSFPTTQLP